MIQSGLLPTPWQQLISWMIQKHEKAIGGVIAIIEYGERRNHTLDRFEWNVVQGKVVMGIHMYGARFEEQIY
jgi:hypothetical protein